MKWLAVKSAAAKFLFTVQMPVSQPYDAIPRPPPSLILGVFTRDHANFPPYWQRSAVMYDKPLGLLQFILRLAVFLYIIIFVMIVQKG